MPDGVDGCATDAGPITAGDLELVSNGSGYAINGRLQPEVHAFYRYPGPTWPSPGPGTDENGFLEEELGITVEEKSDGGKPFWCVTEVSPPTDEYAVSTPSELASTYFTFEAGTVVKWQPVAYFGSPTMYRQVQGYFYLEDENPANVIAADVEVVLEQTLPSDGAGASITAEIDTDLTSATFGQITEFSVTAGGDGYLAWAYVWPCDCDVKEFVLTRGTGCSCVYEWQHDCYKLTVEYRGPNCKPRLTLTRGLACHYEASPTSYDYSQPCDEFGWTLDVENLCDGHHSTVEVAPGGTAQEITLPAWCCEEPATDVDLACGCVINREPLSWPVENGPCALNWNCPDAQLGAYLILVPAPFALMGGGSITGGVSYTRVVRNSTKVDFSQHCRAGWLAVPLTNCCIRWLYTYVDCETLQTVVVDPTEWFTCHDCGVYCCQESCAGANTRGELWNVDFWGPAVNDCNNVYNCDGGAVVCAP
jgi:hypothetical protein